MKDAMTITRLRQNVPGALRKSRSGPVGITRGGETIAFLLSREQVEGLLETVEVLANPEALKAIRAAQRTRPQAGKSLDRLERELARETHR